MTREEAIKVLNMVESHGLADEAKKIAIEALEQTRWIPVSERLPEHPSILASDKYKNCPWVCDSFVCLTFENGIVHVYETGDGADHLIKGDIKSFLKGKKITSCGGRKYWMPPREIIAWMPLPQPYNGESEG